MTDGPLYMLQLELRLDDLVRLGARSRLPVRDLDLGYLTHCQLKALFGDQCPQPFAISAARGRRRTVLAYGSSPPDVLRQHADAFAKPEAHQVCDWDRFAGKPMPSAWPAGHRLGFMVRACPTVRMAREGEHHAKGAEVDAFLARCWAAGDPAVPVDREGVYREWLADAVERVGGARIVASRVDSFKLVPLLRRSQGKERRAARVERPDVTFGGELEVIDGSGFAGLLRRGLGRHRAFGFGMLLLRQVGRH